MGCRGIDHVEDFECDKIVPVGNPFVKQRSRVCFHDLEANLKRLVHPTGDVLHAVWSKAATLSEPGIDGGGVAVAESLDHHECHA